MCANFQFKRSNVRVTDPQNLRNNAYLAYMWLFTTLSNRQTAAHVCFLYIWQTVIDLSSEATCQRQQSAHRQCWRTQGVQGDEAWYRTQRPWTMTTCRIQRNNTRRLAARGQSSPDKPLYNHWRTIAVIHTSRSALCTWSKYVYE